MDPSDAEELEDVGPKTYASSACANEQGSTKSAVGEAAPTGATDAGSGHMDDERCLTSVDGNTQLQVDDYGWTLVSKGPQLRGRAPSFCTAQLTHKAKAAMRVAFSFKGATCTKDMVDVPGHGELPALIISNSLPLDGATEVKSIDWRLTMVLLDGALLMQLGLHSGEKVLSRSGLEHIILTEMSVVTRPGSAYTTATPQGKAVGAFARLVRGAMKGQRRQEMHSAFMINGWQSFGYSGVLHGAMSQPRSVMPYFSQAFHEGVKFPAALLQEDPNVLVSDMFGTIWLRGHGGVVAGYLGQQRGFGGLAVSDTEPPGTEPRAFPAAKAYLFAESHVHEVHQGSRLMTDWALVLPFTSELESTSMSALSSISAAGVSSFWESVVGGRALREYFAAVARHRGSRCSPSPMGWCSWYCHGTNVSEALLMDTLRNLKASKDSGDLPLNLFQLDDGWQSCMGDWLEVSKTRFPNGLKPLADAVRAAGMLPGLWLAPATVLADSAVAAAHPEWVLKDTRGKPVNCGFTAPKRWMWALDFTDKNALRHVREIIRTVVHDWGFGYLKLDFLFCAAMPGGMRHDMSVPRAAVLDLLLTTVREAAGEETFILACGAPLGVCTGRNVDAVRVSADNADHWLAKGPDLLGTRRFFARDETNLPAARNMVRNVLVRLPMQGTLWVNDPDCVIVRPELDLSEARSFATVAAMSGGSLILSEAIDKLPPERLAIFKVMMPPLPHAAQFVRLLWPTVANMAAVKLQPRPGAEALEPWSLVAVFNWTDVPVDQGVDLATVCEGNAVQVWHVFEFWKGIYRRHSTANGRCMAAGLAPRGCQLWAVRPRLPGRAQLVGSDIHISCGLEVSHWAESPSALELAFSVIRRVEAPRVLVQLPGSAGTTPQLSVVGVEGCVGGVSAVNDEVWQVQFPSLSAGEGTRFCIVW